MLHLKKTKIWKKNSVHLNYYLNYKFCKADSFTRSVSSLLCPQLGDIVRSVLS